MVGIAMQAFTVCEKDGTPGLTWNEIEACEVSFIGHLIALFSYVQNSGKKICLKTYF